MAGLAAAWRLTEPDRDPAEVTVYQRGWRLGGKGASSRGPNGRIEEHGLHVWLGFYDNAFRLLRSCYEELDRDATDPACPIRTWRDAFVPASSVGLGQSAGEEDPIWLALFPENDRLPGGAPGGDELTATKFLERGLALLGRFGASLDRPTAPAPRALLASSPVHPSLAARRVPPGAELLHGAQAAFRALAGRDAAARRASEFAELLLAMLRGLLADRLATSGYAAIDHLELRDWLAMHGASRQAVDSPLVRRFYDLSFAYEGGDPSRPRIEAGLALHHTLRMLLDYKGALFWKMRAGMGDVVFAPLYEALRRRGVRFRFFHRLDGLRLSGDRRKVQAVDLGRQARVIAEDYEPLVRVRGLPVFPDRPDLRQVDATEDLLGHNLESHACAWPDTRRVILEAGRDYDALVLAVSLGMVPHTCSQLLEVDERWRAMVEQVGTVATQAFQAWLRPDERALGWDRPAATITGCGEPFDTYASMSHVLSLEAWPAEDQPLAAASFCATLPDTAIQNGVDPTQLVRANAVQFLERRSAALWPHSTDAQGRFRWDVLCTGARPAPAGPARFDSQYWRANVDPSDRYVQALPGTGRHRIRADASGFENLYLAGDWTDNGLNAGCIEAAVLGGIHAANAIDGCALEEGTSGGYRPRGGKMGA